MDNVLKCHFKPNKTKLSSGLKSKSIMLAGPKPVR